MRICSHGTIPGSGAEREKPPLNANPFYLFSALVFPPFEHKVVNPRVMLSTGNNGHWHFYVFAVRWFDVLSIRAFVAYVCVKFHFQLGTIPRKTRNWE